MTRQHLRFGLFIPCALLVLLHQSPYAAGEPQRLVAVANLNNPVGALTDDELRRIVTGEQVTWPDGRRLTIVLREAGAADRALLLRLCCKLTEADYSKHLLLSTFRQSQFAPRTVSSVASVLKFIANVPGSLGFVPAADVTPAVKPLRVPSLSTGSAETARPLP